MEPCSVCCVGSWAESLKQTLTTDFVYRKHLYINTEGSCAVVGHQISVWLQKYFKDAVRMGRVTYFLDLLKVKMWVELIGWNSWMSKLCFSFILNTFTPAHAGASRSIPVGSWPGTAASCMTWCTPSLQSCSAHCCTMSWRSRGTACCSPKEPQGVLWVLFPFHRVMVALSMAASSILETLHWIPSVSLSLDLGSF